MKTNPSKKFPTVPVVTVVAILLVISATLAMFFSNVDVNRVFQLSNFSAQGVVTFDGVAAADDGGRGYLVDVKNASAANYIGKMRVQVQYAGMGVGLIRVRVVEEWSTGVNDGVRQVMPYAIKMPYQIGANNANLYPATGTSGNARKWFDNRENDYRFYYATPVNCTSSSPVSLDLITGFDTSSIDLGAIADGTQLHIRVEADIVQVNRYPQYWGMTSLPWSSADSRTQQDIAA